MSPSIWVLSKYFKISETLFNFSDFFDSYNVFEIFLKFRLKFSKNFPKHLTIYEHSYNIFSFLKHFLTLVIFSKVTIFLKFSWNFVKNFPENFPITLRRSNICRNLTIVQNLNIFSIKHFQNFPQVLSLLWNFLKTFIPQYVRSFFYVSFYCMWATSCPHKGRKIYKILKTQFVHSKH